MRKDPPSISEVGGWLDTLGVETLCQWDVLVFLYRHQSSLVGAEHLALLLGYATGPVLAALDVLDCLGLVERSRVSQGARLYQFLMPYAPPRGESFERLYNLVGRRDGRIVLSRQLRREEPTPADRPEEEGSAARRRSRLRGEGRAPWRKAI